jgi:hypothetical protein
LRVSRRLFMRKLVLFTLALSLTAGVALAHDHAASQDKKGGALTAWVADSHCAAKHAKAGGEKCVAKCIEGGAKTVLVTPDGDTVLTVSNPEKLSAHLGKLVKVQGSVNMEEKTITVASVEAAEAPAAQEHKQH